MHRHGGLNTPSASPDSWLRSVVGRVLAVSTGLAMVATMLSMVAISVAAAPPASAATSPAAGDSSAEAEALAEAARTGQRVEVTQEDTETVTVWANPDGTITTDIAQAPVRVPDENGVLVPVDLDLQTDAGRLAPAASDAEVSLSATGDGTLAEVRNSGAESYGLSFDDELDKPSTEGNAATYDVAGGETTQVQVSAASAGFSAHVVLSERPTEAPVYTFPLALHGLQASLVQNGDAGKQLLLKDAAGKLVGQSSPLSMWDARVDHAGDPVSQVPVDAALVSTGDGPALELKPSMAYLSDASTQYPVTVDPDVSNVRHIEDSFISSVTQDTNYNTLYRIVAGSPDGTGIYRGFQGFDIDKLLGQNVTSATLNMYQYFQGDSTCATHTVKFYPVQDPVVNVTWNTQPSLVNNDPGWMTTNSSNAGADGSGCPNPAWQHVNVTKIINGYVSGELSSRLDGPNSDDKADHMAEIELRAEYESNANSDTRYCSLQSTNAPAGHACNSSTRVPTLSVTYAPQVGLMTSYSTVNRKLSDHATLAVNNDSGNLVVKNSDLHVAGIGQDLSLTRWYNSQATGTTTSLGKAGWSLSGGPDVYLDKVSTTRYDYHAPDGHIYGAYARKDTDSAAAAYKQFYEPKYGGGNASLVDNGDGTFTLTFHSSQKKYKFKAIGSSGDLYLWKTIDRSGNTITYNYGTGTGTRLSSITDTAGRSFSVSYNASGYITSITDNNITPARYWTYAYTGDNLTSYTEPSSGDGSVAYTYSQYSGTTKYYLTKIINPVQKGITSPNNGKSPTTVLTYENGQAKNVQYQTGMSGTTPVYATNTWYYDSGDGASCHNDPDRTTKVNNSKTHNTIYCFADRKPGGCQSVDVVDAESHHRGNSFSPNDQATSITSPENDGVTDGSTTATYGSGDGGAQDQVQTVTQPKDNADTSPDKSAKSTIKYNASSSIPGYRYLPTSKIGFNLRCTKYTYYGTSENGTGLIKDTTIGLDPGANLDCSSTTGSQVWHNVYNAKGSIIAAWDANGSDVASTHDGTGETVYTYWASGDSGIAANGVGELKSVRKPGGSCTGTIKLCTTYTYDGDGRMLTKTDGRGEKTSYSYDNNDRTTQILLHGATTCVLTSGNCLQYKYDGNGNLYQRDDATGQTTLSYDLLNQQATQHTPDGIDVNTTYDTQGKLQTYIQSIPDGSGPVTDTVTYVYNNADNLTKVTDRTGDITITPNKDGKPNDISFPTTSHPFGLHYDYFKSGKTKAIHATDAGLSTLPSYDYTYKNSLGFETDQLQKETISTSNGSTSFDGVRDFDYGTTERLSSVSDSTSAGPNYTYKHDDAGQLYQIDSGTSSHTYMGYDLAGQLCWQGSTDLTSGNHGQAGCPTKPGGDTQYYNDDAGQSLGTSTTANVYDANQRAATLNGVPQSYSDQGNDLRATAGTGPTAENFANGPLGVTARKTSSGVMFYTRDDQGHLLDEHADSGSSDTNYYLANYLGSITALVSASGDSLNGSYTYSPYGATSGDPQSGGTTASINPWRFASGYQDALEGDNYYHFGARYYDQAAGRWTQADPKMGSIDDPSSLLTYGYGSNDPVNRTDLSGRDDNDLAQCIGGYVQFGAGVALVGFGLTAEAPSAGLSTGLVLGGIALAGEGFAVGGACGFF